MATVSEKTRKLVLNRDGYACTKCLRSHHLQVHHLDPRRKKGSDEPDNLVTLCETCHQEWTVLDLKGASLVFADWLELPPARAMPLAHNIAWPDDISAAEMQEVAKGAWGMLKAMVQTLDVD
jgi:hypothetical protein